MNGSDVSGRVLPKDVSAVANWKAVLHSLSTREWRGASLRGLGQWHGGTIVLEELGNGRLN